MHTTSSNSSSLSCHRESLDRQTRRSYSSCLHSADMCSLLGSDPLTPAGLSANNAHTPTDASAWTLLNKSHMQHTSTLMTAMTTRPTLSSREGLGRCARRLYSSRLHSASICSLLGSDPCAPAGLSARISTFLPLNSWWGSLRGLRVVLPVVQKGWSKWSNSQYGYSISARSCPQTHGGGRSGGSAWCCLWCRSNGKSIG